MSQILSTKSTAARREPGKNKKKYESPRVVEKQHIFLGVLYRDIANDDDEIIDKSIRPVLSPERMSNGAIPLPRRDRLASEISIEGTSSWL